MAGFLIALLSGALMSVQGVFNAQVTKTTGIWVSNGWVQLSAFLLCLFVWLATGRDSVVALMEVQPRGCLSDLTIRNVRDGKRTIFMEKTDWIVDRSRWNCSFPMEIESFAGIVTSL